MKPQQNVPMPPAAPVLLTYGTHDRSGPWWQRWLRAWARAGKPALIAAAVAAALAYSVAPRRYTAVATIIVEPDLITQAHGNTTSPEQDAARADALARSLKNTKYLAAVLNAAEWRNARFAHPGQTLFEPISAESMPGTKTVRVMFTDPSREAARAGADATVQALNPIDPATTRDPVDLVRQSLAPIEEREQQLRVQLAAAEREAPAATQPAPRAAVGGRMVRPTPNRATLLSRQLLSVQRQRTAMERQLASTPQVRRGEPATVPRFASNQKELAVTGLIAAGLVFPLAFFLALVHAWRYGRGATVQSVSGDDDADEGGGDRIMNVADLAAVIMDRRRGRPSRAAARRALGPAAVAAAIAAAVACSFAPRRYTATATLIAAPPPAPAGAAAPSTAPGTTATAAEAIAALAETAAGSQVLRQVISSQQWQLARARAADSLDGVTGPPPEPRIDVSSDSQTVVIRFTDTDRDAARYGAEAAMNAARGRFRGVSIDPMSLAMRRRQLLQLQAAQARMPRTSNLALDQSIRQVEAQLDAASSTHSDAVRLAVAQLPAAVTSVPLLPSNYGEILGTAVVPAACAFAVGFLLAMTWIRRREVRLALRHAAGNRRVVASLAFLKPAIRPAAVAAVFAGLIAYTVTPRTYTAAVTLQIYPPAPPPPPPVTAVAAAAMMPNVPPFGSRMGERPPRMVPSAALQPDLSKGTLRITYTDPEPDVAASSANAIASSLVQSWHRNIHHQDLFTMFGPRGIASAAVYPASRRELENWSIASAGCEVKVADTATPPRWADQLQPIKTAAVVATIAFLSVLFAMKLVQAPRALREQAAAQPALA